MAKFRVKAIFIHEHEKQAASDAVKTSIIQFAEWTDGYVMGVVDESNIEGLSKNGLVISVVEEVKPTPSAQTTAFAMLPLSAAPKKFRRQLQRVHTTRASEDARRGAAAGPSPLVPIASEKQQTDQKILSRDARRASFYIVRFHGPLTKTRQAELKEREIKLLERVSRNRYTVRLKPSEIKILAALDSVDTIRLYTKEDTFCDAREEPEERPAARRSTGGGRGTGGGQKAESRSTQVYSVILHRTEDMSAVLRWLKGKKIKPMAKTRDSFRVALAAKSRLLSELAAHPEVAVVEPVTTPQMFDDRARQILQLDSVAKNPTGLEGDGEIIGIADTGIDVGHADFQNRIVGTSAWGRPGDVSDPDGHGTHVAGCVAGDGTASGGVVRGAAPKAKIFFQSILDATGRLGGLPADLGAMFNEAYSKNVRIHNNSWGAFTFAQYTETAIQVDRFVADHPDMLIVIAAGNDGIGVPRAAGTVMSAPQGFVDWPSVAAPATAKNGLTVGASRNSRKSGGLAALTWGEAWDEKYPHKPISNEKISGNDQCMAAFSSRGPSNDLRIKPDVVAPGTDIAAAKSNAAPLRRYWGAYPGNSKYAFMGGTSMAAPYVAGCAVLVREWYRKKGGSPTPSAALIKATLINGTQRISGACAVAPPAGDPNFHQGFGRIDMASTLPNTKSPNLKLEFFDTWKTPSESLGADERRRFQFKVNAGQSLRICLAWTDPGPRALQNSLTLIADNGKGIKWVGNAGVASILNIAGAPSDPNNNVQLIRIDKPHVGTYTIAVIASNILMPPQSFALVVTGNVSPWTMLP